MEELILRSLRGESSDLDERQLRRWRRASLENETHYRELVWLWKMDPHDLPAGEVPERPSLDAITKRADARRYKAVPLHRRRGTGHARWFRRVAAAAAMLVIGFGISQMLPDGEPTVAFGAAEFTTGSTETVTVTLNDGSFVRLAPSSRLRVVGGDDAARNVWLDGRAYFAVMEDEARPFTVRTRVGDALVLGTRFEVSIQEDNLRLAVAEGRVSLAAGDERVGLQAGDVSHVKAGAGPSVVQVDDIHALLDWPGGLLVFQSTPLDQVARELERHFGVAFQITDAAVGQRTVTGWFGDESLDEVLTAVCRATATRCSLEANRVRVTPTME